MYARVTNAPLAYVPPYRVASASRRQTAEDQVKELLLLLLFLPLPFLSYFTTFLNDAVIFKRKSYETNNEL